MGDYLTGLGFQCKFRNPRVEGSQYPSLLVDWYDEDEVAALVNEQHAALKAEQERGSDKQWATRDFAIQISDRFTHLSIDPRACDAAQGRVALEAHGAIVFTLTVRPGASLERLSFVVAEWTGLRCVSAQRPHGEPEELSVSSSTSDTGQLTVVINEPGKLCGVMRVTFE